MTYMNILITVHKGVENVHGMAFCILYFISLYGFL